MYSIGIDVGSTFIKYCVMDDGIIKRLFMEKTPVRQKEYFDVKITILRKEYPEADIVSCGYGRKNVPNMASINELTALAKGCYYATGNNGIILDIGGQDTKIIFQEKGKLKEFFINDKCAAGSGMFLSNTLNMIGVDFQNIDLSAHLKTDVSLSSACAVFAQSDIVGLITDNRTEPEIIWAVLWQIFAKAKLLLTKMKEEPILLSGGFSQIKGISSFATSVLGRECFAIKHGEYLAAVGCALELG